MAQNIYRRDTKVNLLEITPSSKEIFTIEDSAKHGIMAFGNLRTIGQLLEKDLGLEVRDWDTVFGKGIAGNNSFDISTSIIKFGTGAIGNYSVASGSDTTASGTGSVASGTGTVASGDYSVTSGSDNTASGANSVASGINTTASGDNSHVEGNLTFATSENSHAEGSGTISSGANSHSEGLNTTAEGVSSHAEGNSTSALGIASHTEGSGTTSSGDNSHSEGLNTTASGTNSHAEGNSTSALGIGSHAQGNTTIALNDYSTSIGNYNVGTSTENIFEVGIGELGLEKNGLEVLFDGQVKIPSITYTQQKIGDGSNIATINFIYEKELSILKTPTVEVTLDLIRDINFTLEIGSDTLLKRPINLKQGQSGLIFLKNIEINNSWGVTVDNYWVSTFFGETITVLPNYNIVVCKYEVFDENNISIDIVKNFTPHMNLVLDTARDDYLNISSTEYLVV